MNTFYWIAVAILANLFVGCGVCAAIDDDDKRLYKWYCKGPVLIAWLVPFLWPVTAYFWFRGERK